jgi:hypothetical protein
MGLRKRGKYRYGDSQSDIREELLGYAKGSYLPTQFADAVCQCGSLQFTLLLDEDEGAVVRTCTLCQQVHPIGDSGEYLEDAELEQCACPCGGEVFEVTIGLALYEGSKDVRWLYLGCRCPGCELTACYGDWKNEYEGYETLLNRV